jgi:GT2 family glycosyltransferase
MYDVTVSIVSYNTISHLRDCLTSIEAQSANLRMETIVIDNASEDGSAEMVERRFPTVHLIRNAQNRYFSAAHNQGIRIASGRHVIILNPDTKLLPDTVAGLTAFMEAHDDVGAATCTFLDDNGKPRRSETANYWRSHSLPYAILCRSSLGERIYRTFGGRIDAGSGVAPGSVVDTDVVSGACVIARTDLVRRLGGFDEQLLMYSTEDDLCARIKALGFRVCYYEAPRLVHSLSVSVRKSNPYRIRWIYARDVMRYFRKHGNARARIFAAPLLAAAYLVDACVIASRGGKWR